MVLVIKENYKLKRLAMRRELDGMHDELVKQDEENMSLKLALGEAKQRAALPFLPLKM